MAVTVVYTAKVPTRKKLIKQYKSKAAADRAIEALGKKFNFTFYTPKPSKLRKRKRK